MSDFICINRDCALISDDVRCKISREISPMYPLSCKDTAATIAYLDKNETAKAVLNLGVRGTAYFVMDYEKRKAAYNEQSSMRQL